MRHQQIRVANRQHRPADAHRRHAENGVRRGLDRVRQLHATQLVILRRRQHAGACIRSERIVRRLRQDHFFAIEMRLLQIHKSIERCVLVLGDFFGGIEHRAERPRAVISKSRTHTKLTHLEPVIQQKIQRCAHS